MDKRDFRGAALGSLILAPAVGEYLPGDQVSFLFSISQVEDILGALVVERIPFSPAYISGISDWRGHALPVLSLEKLLGLEANENAYEGTRALVVKKTSPSHEPEHFKRGLVRIAPGCRLVSTIPETEPLLAADYLAADILPAVKGLYRWAGGLLIVPHIEQILGGELNRVFCLDA